MIVDVFEMVLVAIGAVFTAVLIWLLMRKYDRDHPVAVSLDVRNETVVSPASPVTMSSSDTAKPDVIVASDTAAGANVGAPLASPDSKDALKSHLLASPPGGQEATQTTPPSDAQPQSSSAEEAPHAEKPAESKPAEKPAESKPAEKPAESKPAERPAESKPAEQSTNLRRSGKQRKGSRGSADSGLTVTCTKEQSERDQRKRKLKKSFGVTSAAARDASAMKTKHSKRKLAKAAPTGIEAGGGANASAVTPTTPGSGVAGNSDEGSPRDVNGEGKAEMPEHHSVLPERAPRTESGMPKVSTVEDPRADVAGHGQSPLSPVHKPASKRKHGKASLSPTAPSSAETAGVVSSSHVALSPPPAGTGESSTSPGVGPPSAADPNVQELRALHIRRASRLPDAAPPAHRHKSQVPRSYDIFSVEHSAAEEGVLNAPPENSKPDVPSPPPPK